MARGGPKVEDDNSSGQGDSNASRQAKRRCVQSACVPCRKRKSKCDGGTPMCATCTAVYKTDCYYDEASESRRTKAAPAIKRENPSTAESNDNSAEFLVKTIHDLPESEVTELIHQIRREPRLDIARLADTWRQTVTLPFRQAGFEQASLESDLSTVLGKAAFTQTGESRHFGHTSGLGLVAEDENYTRSGSRVRQPPEDYKNGTWTNVTQDLRFVESLLDLYFRWSHPFYVIFSRECFYRDFQSGRQKYCSPLLVNAILAYACHFTDDPAGRTDPDNFRTAGDHFFAEARRLLYENEEPSLTTTQALCVMAMREPSAGRDSSGFMYIGRCMRMAIELGLHVNRTASAAGITPSEMEVRKVTFWGCFTVDMVWSLSVGRIAQLPRAAITLDKPILEEAAPGNSGAHQLAPGPITSRMFLQQFSALAELINDATFMYYAPKERLTSRRLLDMYAQFQNWYSHLPLALRLPEGDLRPLAHIMVLHMLYWTVIVHLFRPMLKVEIIHSDIRPRDICIDSSNKVSELLRTYRKHYDLRACQLVFTHILLSVSVVHLINSQGNSLGASNLVESLQALEDLSICHYFGARSFKIVHKLAKTWNLPFPDALKLSKLVPKSDDAPLMSPPHEMFHHRTTPAPQEIAANGYNPLPSGGLPQRRESLSMFAQDHRNASISSIHSPPSISSHSQLQSPSSTLTFAATTPGTVGPASTAENAETLFWTGIPGIGVPILHRNYQMSPMDLNNMLGNVDEWDRFGRDGFKMSSTWGQEQVAFSGGSVGGNASVENSYQNEYVGDMVPSGPGHEWGSGGGSWGTGAG